MVRLMIDAVYKSMGAILLNSDEWNKFKIYRELRINSVVNKTAEDWEAIKLMTVNEFNDLVLYEFLQNHLSIH